jgi:hypothetical protein
VDLSHLRDLLDSRWVLGIVCTAAGAFLGNFVAVYRLRIRFIEYTVNHQPLGLSAEDAVFGSVKVTWQGHEVTNLFLSTLTIQNTTFVDYTNLHFRIFTGTTLLLTERSEIVDTSFMPTLTEDFMRQITAAPGTSPSAAQFELVRHRREYMVPVLNRGQRIIFTYLTTVPTAGEAPYVWADMLHPGAQVMFRPAVGEIHGVPVRMALPLGLFVCLVIAVAATALIGKGWIVAILCTSAGLVAQTLGAWVYRAFRFVRGIIFH